jgi:predicted nucleotidyltransferase
MLKSRFSVRRVILIGSLAHEAGFSALSDVDLAVEGLAGDDYWEAWRMVEDIIAERPIDLIDVETAGESMLRTIERYGIEL